MTSAEVRSRLVDALILDLIGPIADDSLKEERIEENPSRWYLTGFLVPDGRASIDLDRDRNPAPLLEEDDPDADFDALYGGDDPVDFPTEERPASDDSGKDAVMVTSLPRTLPSSMGLSMLVPVGTPELQVSVCWGDYTPNYAPGEKPPGTSDAATIDEPFTLAGLTLAVKPERREPKIVFWSREPRNATLKLDLRGEFTHGTRSKPIPGSDGLKLEWFCRPAPRQALDERLAPDGAWSVNVYLVNSRKAIQGKTKDRAMAFQAELTVRCPGGFIPRPSLSGLDSTDPDSREADLQYRDVCEFAVGHNVSASAKVDDHCRCEEVRTAWVPRAFVHRVEPRRMEGITLAMEELAALADFAAAHAAMIGLSTEYRAWIIKQHRSDGEYHYPQRAEQAKDLLGEAGRTADRIARGIEELRDPKVFFAFKLANDAMARQARRRNPGDVPEWRPFQLAFLLLNLPGLVHPDHNDRDIVDLLFFPTGGGKTEAYLGLAAFTLVYRRLREGVGGPIPLYAGVTVLMRYTLRLLTLDQLSRASALVCALELIREENLKTLGTWRFEIGLWVGSAATPNYMGRPGDPHGAVHKVLEYKQGKSKHTPVPLEKCPWCGSAFVPSSFSLHPSQDRAEELTITCLGDDCDFSGDRSLPIQVIDEPIYHRLPGFLIATVDKFAGMPWKGEIAKLFGRAKSFDRQKGFLNDCDPRPGVELEHYLPPPELIIQDELHLISGPLGTVAGLYETAIDHLCHRDEKGPKIVSSTATVRRASDQIRALFGRAAAIFPSPGPDRRDSFFAQTLTNDQSARMYLGVAAQGRSAKRVLLNTYLALMSAANKLYHEAGGNSRVDNPVDPYMTMLGYFNSLRELGGTRRLIEDELTSRLNQYGRRKRVGETDAPFRNREIRGEARELTSRYGTSEVAEAKDALGRPFRQEGSVDIALATNMISVGLDISRLGMMAVFAQPKMTSEYIQATSRVGRQADKPGLIVTIFNMNRPRDRSHYERFRFFHETFYRSVEATSVTPFSPRALDRALFAVAVALTRLDHDFMIRDGEADKILQNNSRLDKVAEVIARRARLLGIEGADRDPLEQTETYSRVRKALDTWFGYAEDLAKNQVKLNYTSDSSSTTRKLLHEMLDPKLGNLEKHQHQFKAPRSMRDVEPVVAILPRQFGKPDRQIKVGKTVAVSSLRQSQLVTTYGPGAMIDLPSFAVVVAGVDFWHQGPIISEPRLEAKAALALRWPSVSLASPRASDKLPDAQSKEGVIAWRFPLWSMTQKTSARKDPDGTLYQTRQLVPKDHVDPQTGRFDGQDVVPVRFVRACNHGHMRDIEWRYFAHRGQTQCASNLWFDDTGTTGDLNELRIRCECGTPPRKIKEAAGSNNPTLGQCDASQAWLGPAAKESGERCDLNTRLLVRTASNAHFAQLLTVISLPDLARELDAAVGKLWALLSPVDGIEFFRLMKKFPEVSAGLAGYSDEAVMQAIESRREGKSGPPQRSIKEAEFELLTSGKPVIGSDETDGLFFAEECRGIPWRKVIAERVERVLVIHRLREVKALLGYTRFEPVSPDIDGEFDLDVQRAKLGVTANWLPASENKGEGLFVQFRKEVVDAWAETQNVRKISSELERGTVQWSEERGVPKRKFFGVRHTMLHSLSHLLINAISLECGYPASAFKERIYANPNQGYGILLYTAGADSFGTLGGLANAAKTLDHYLDSALEMGRLCSNDPICAQHNADDRNERRYLQGAACHGCLLISETSCESFNDFLDRSLVVPTVACRGAEFFPGLA